MKALWILYHKLGQKILREHTMRLSPLLGGGRDQIMWPDFEFLFFFAEIAAFFSNFGEFLSSKYHFHPKLSFKMFFPGFFFSS